MSSGSSGPQLAAQRSSALLRHLNSPVLRSGYALILSSGATAVLGFLFWVVAARTFTTEEVGIAVAAIAMTELISNLANLGWKSGLLRFVGEAGSGTRRLIASAYVTAATAALVGGIIFLVGQPWWTPDLSDLRSGAGPAILFVFTCIAWVIFQLEDSALIGLQRSSWVPIENSIFSALRIALLVPFTAVGSSLGIYYAWAFAMFPLVAVINLLLVRRLPRTGPGTESRLDTRDVIAFAGADWLANTAGLMMVTVIPLIVLASEGASALGYYYLAWTMANTVNMVSSSVSDALIAQAGTDKLAIRDNAAKVARVAMAISLPLVAVLIVGAPWLLSIFGDEYADEGTSLLRVMAVSSLPYIVFKIYTAVARSEQRNRTVVASSWFVSVVVVGLTPPMLAWFGLVGVGIAWVVGLTTMAVFVLLTDFIDWWGVHPSSRAVNAAGSTRRSRAARREREWVEAQLDQVPEFQISAGVPEHRWHLVESWSEGAIVSLHDADTPGTTTIRFARTEREAEALARHWHHIRDIETDESLRSWRRLAPRPCSWRPDAAPAHLVERGSQGISSVKAVATGLDPAVLSARIVDAIRPLHILTGHTHVVDNNDVDQWINHPVAQLQARGIRRHREGLDALRQRLDDAWRGSTIGQSHILANLSTTNVWLDPESHEVAQFPSWRRARIGPTTVDLGHLAVTTRASRHGRELGHEITHLLSDPTLLASDPVLGGVDSPVAPIDIVLLAWLWHVESSPLQAHPIWMVRNVEVVLGALRAKSGEQA